MALPGSQLYKYALLKKIKLPDDYEGYSFHSYNTLPLPTESLTAAQVLSMRDQKFIKYHQNKNFLDKVEKFFGKQARNNITEMTKITIQRKIIDNEKKK